MLKGPRVLLEKLIHQALNQHIGVESGADGLSAERVVAPVLPDVVLDGGSLISVPRLCDHRIIQKVIGDFAEVPIRNVEFERRGHLLLVILHQLGNYFLCDIGDSR